MGRETFFNHIAYNRNHIWDGKNITEANELLSNITSPGFIAAFQVNLYIFGYTKPLSILLQGSTIDLCCAFKEINIVKLILLEIRNDSEQEFKRIYEKMVKMANKAGLEGMLVPRTCGRQNFRNNMDFTTPEEYWRRTVFVPFMDHLNKEFAERFSKLSENSLLGMKLIPSHVASISAHDEAGIIHHFKEDLPSPGLVAQELRRWKTLWSGISEDASNTLPEKINSSIFSLKSFPNIATILHVLSITPVTVATTERANSALKHIKTQKRSMMGQDRLNALLLLFIHKDISLNYDAVIDLYANRYPRRMSFLNPLS